jgi:hypothetical protein
MAHRLPRPRCTQAPFAAVRSSLTPFEVRTYALPRRSVRPRRVQCARSGASSTTRLSRQHAPQLPQSSSIRCVDCGCTESRAHHSRITARSPRLTLTAAIVESGPVRACPQRRISSESSAQRAISVNDPSRLSGSSILILPLRKNRAEKPPFLTWRMARSRNSGRNDRQTGRRTICTDMANAECVSRAARSGDRSHETPSRGAFWTRVG